MKPNRSIPSATVIPVLIYPDVREAVAWLEAAFGFQERVRIGEAHRAQMSFGDGAVIAADVRGVDVLGDARGRRPGGVGRRVDRRPGRLSRSCRASCPAKKCQRS
jgi:hypothetical protein